MNKGKSSNNSSLPTKVYELLTATCGEDPTEEQTSKFIDEYLAERNINTAECINNYKKDWEEVQQEYQKRAEAIFEVELPQNVTAYLTVNNRCPYSIENNYFFVSMTGHSPVRKTVMHELWHFYTWYGLGEDQEEKLGKQKYNDLKEALTVLLNIECQDLLPEGESDNGYPQHAELRQKMLAYWDKDKNIGTLWKYLMNHA